MTEIKKTLCRFIMTTNNKDIGLMYLYFSIFCTFIGAFLSVLMRLELMESGVSIFPTGHEYNAVVTAHGFIMLFYVVMPALYGAFGNYIMPLHIGAPDMSFPRMNALSFWLLFFSFFLLLVSLFTPGGPGGSLGFGGGWTIYPPLSSKLGHPGISTDIALMAIVMAGFSSIFGAINFVTTILNMRCKEIGLWNMSLFCWTIFFGSIVILFAIPVLAGAVIMLFLDRNFGSSFYDFSQGGNPVMYQHLFWFFGHPEVYVIIFPAFGVISVIISTFSQRDVYGYKGMVGALASIVLLGTFVWAHHMFTAGISLTTSLFFNLGTLLIAVPTGVKVFSWIATMWKGSIVFSLPMIWAISFIGFFVLGGITGVFLANSGMSSVFHDTYFVVGHFHFVLSIAVSVAIIAGYLYWFPKMHGYMYNTKIGIIQFVVFCFGVLLIFIPQHFLGLAGMPRRYVDYPAAFEYLNKLSSIGAFISFFSFFLLIVLIIEAFVVKRKAPDNPWGVGAKTLEWSLSSPPPLHPFMSGNDETKG